MYSMLAWNVQNQVGFWGQFSQDPVGELTTLPLTPSRRGLLAFGNRSFAPSTLAISPTHMFVCEKLEDYPLPRVHSLGAYRTSIFFTSNMSHYLKVLKICPGSDPLPFDFVLDKRLWISWFLRLLFCGRFRNLEFWRLQLVGRLLFYNEKYPMGAYNHKVSQ